MAENCVDLAESIVHVCESYLGHTTLKTKLLLAITYHDVLGIRLLDYQKIEWTLFCHSQSILTHMHMTKLTALDKVHMITNVIHKLAHSLLIWSSTNTASLNCIDCLTRLNLLRVWLARLLDRFKILCIVWWVIISPLVY